GRVAPFLSLLALLGFPLLCHVGLAASTAHVLPALPALPSSVCPTAEPCGLPLDEGQCQRYTLRWYYNQRVSQCRPFVYSGCQGNLNRFDSKEECELHCRQRPGAGTELGTAAGTSSTPTLCRGPGSAELGGQCWSQPRL
uniref:BPTI/Kunitz inhibitor domain-containing protein n=1 Tax=Taeniopygia guttata TaxID=59729 RepID=A0A674HV33_TAEGU